MSDDVIERVLAAPPERALEAVNLLAGDTLGSKPDDELLNELAGATRVAADEVNAAIQRVQPGEAVDLARVVLVAYADAGYEDEVAAALDAAGQTAFLLEIAAIGLLSLAVLHTIQTRGKKSEEERTTTVVQPTGETVTTVDKRVTYFSVGESLAPLLQGLLARIK